ncbi:MAG: hypothetical protein K2Y08_02370 [Alphaproteobacteria bacterium]|nr:hypothetical protein [Alphaproteobacteria bacterium]
MKPLILFSSLVIAVVASQTAQAKLNSLPERLHLIESYYGSTHIKEAKPSGGRFLKEVDEERGVVKKELSKKQRPHVRDIAFLTAPKQASLEILKSIIEDSGGINTLNLGPVLGAYIAAGFPDIAETQPLNRMNPHTGFMGDPLSFYTYGVAYKNPPERKLKLPEARRKARLVRDMVGLNSEVNQLVRDSRNHKRQIPHVESVFPARNMSTPSVWREQQIRPWAKRWKNVSSGTPRSFMKKTSVHKKQWAKRVSEWNDYMGR